MSYTDYIAFSSMSILGASSSRNTARNPMYLWDGTLAGELGDHIINNLPKELFTKYMK